MSFEFAGFIIGVVGAIWIKVSMQLFNQERDKPEIEKLRPQLENPSLEAFVRGLSLILIGLGMETFARLFLN